MKKSLAVLLLVVISVCACVPAFADPQFSTTRDFLAVLEKENLSCHFNGLISTGEEHIAMANADENFAYDIDVYFHEDNDFVSVFVRYIIGFSDADFPNVLRVVNELNYSYKYVRFYVDESNNTVTCAMNIILQDAGDTGNIVLEGLLRMANILKVAYPKLAVYNVK